MDAEVKLAQLIRCTTMYSSFGLLLSHYAWALILFSYNYIRCYVYVHMQCLPSTCILFTCVKQPYYVVRSVYRYYVGYFV